MDSVHIQHLIRHQQRLRVLLPSGDFACRGLAQEGQRGGGFRALGVATVDGKTGEVFFATAKGICSFRSTATEGTAENSNVLVFPNPVPPGYTGSIAIRGLAENATVKITELDGRLVYQTRALGGQAVWNGKNYKGGSVATGVYLVLVSDDTRTQKTVAKIVFISK